jgi:hypothetical protein
LHCLHDGLVAHMSSFLVPSQVIAPQDLCVSSDGPVNGKGAQVGETASHSVSKKHSVRRNRQRKRVKKNWKRNNVSYKSSNYSRPNVWSYIPEDHLREHPLYAPLPETIHKIESFQDLAKFRQSSLQWVLMHEGRLTTSRAAGAIGLLEPLAAAKLGIPKSLSGNGKARSSFYHVRKAPLFRSLDESKEVLLRGAFKSLSGAKTGGLDSGALSSDGAGSEASNKWVNSSTKDKSRGFAYTYVGEAYEKNGTSQNIASAGSRMAYGNIQEPTGILVAVNHFSKKGHTVQECGMFAGETLFLDRGPARNYSTVEQKQVDLLRELHQLGCPIGASPDGLIISNSTGEVQVLEVKNHLNLSPMALKSFARMSTWYVVQLQLEMLCVGFHCQSAVLVRLSATKGSVLLSMKRDDEYIACMLQRFVSFYKSFVVPNIEPPTNFDHNDESLIWITKRTNRLASQSQLVRRISPGQIQRSPSFFHKHPRVVERKQNQRSQYMEVDW